MLDNSTEWINSVFSYILPRLNSMNAMEEEDSTEKIATNMLLKVVKKLLLPNGVQCESSDVEPNYLLNSPSKRYG